MKPKIFLTALLLLIAACGVDNKPNSAPPLPRILSITPDKVEVPLYERIEFSIDLDANYGNPFDSREISLEAAFTGPDGSIWAIPGFGVRIIPGESGLHHRLLAPGRW
jgi:hypothetical protein